MSRLPPGRPVCPSEPLPLRLSPLAFSFPLILVFHGSVLPRNICHTSRLSAFFPSARVFTCQIFSFLSLPLSPSNLVSLSVRQDKLSEEVQKQHDGPEENGSLPATQTEPDTGPPPNADPDASQAEEDKDKTKPLLERLKALEVTTFLFFFHTALFSLFLSFRLCSSPLLPLHPHFQPPLAILCGWPVCQLSESLLACVWKHDSSSNSPAFFVWRAESSYESRRGGLRLYSGFGLFSSALRDLSCTPPRAPSNNRAQQQWSMIIVFSSFFFFYLSHWTHPLRSLQQLMHSDLIELGHMSHILIPKWLHGLDVDVLEGHTVFASSQGLYTTISHNLGSWHSHRCPLTCTASWQRWPWW